MINLKLITSILIIAAAFGSAVWNLHIKRASKNLNFVALMVIPQFIITFPLTLILPLPPLNTFSYLIASSIVQTAYIIFLNNAYTHGLMNRVYPLAIGVAPLISLLYIHFYLGSTLTPLEYVGMFILSVGIASFAFLGKHPEEFFNAKSVAYALGTSFFIFCYSSIDSIGIKTTPYTLSYISWLFSIKALLFFVPMVGLGKINWQVIHNTKYYMWSGLLAGLGYAIAIWAFVHTATPIVLALRSTSILFVFLLSVFVLKEKTNIQTFLLTLTTCVGVFLILMSSAA